MARSEAALRSRLLKVARIAVQGTLVESYLRCGTPSCGCHRDPARRHGPHTYLKFRHAKGRATAIYVPRVHVEAIRRAVDAWNELWQISVALSEGHREAWRTRLRRRTRAATGD